MLQSKCFQDLPFQIQAKALERSYLAPETNSELRRRIYHYFIEEIVDKQCLLG